MALAEAGFAVGLVGRTREKLEQTAAGFRRGRRSRRSCGVRHTVVCPPGGDPDIETRLSRHRRAGEQCRVDEL